MAQKGYSVWGVDLSPSMLEQFEMKLASQPLGTRQRVRLVKGDMAGFRLKEKVSLIIIPFRSFQSLTEEGQQKSCQQSVRSHLEDGGVFIINVFKPNGQLDQTWVYEEVVQWEAVDEKSGRRIVKKHRGPKIDVVKQIIYPEFTFQIHEPDGKVWEAREPLQLKYYYYGQLKSLLQSQGFSIQEEFGYYDKRDIAHGSELIFVCSKQ